LVETKEKVLDIAQLLAKEMNIDTFVFGAQPRKKFIIPQTVLG